MTDNNVDGQTKYLQYPLVKYPPDPANSAVWRPGHYKFSEWWGMVTMLKFRLNVQPMINDSIFSVYL